MNAPDEPDAREPRLVPEFDGSPALGPVFNVSEPELELVEPREAPDEDDPEEDAEESQGAGVVVINAFAASEGAPAAEVGTATVWPTTRMDSTVRTRAMIRVLTMVARRTRTTSSIYRD